MIIARQGSTAPDVENIGMGCAQISIDRQMSIRAAAGAMAVRSRVFEECPEGSEQEPPHSLKN